MNEILAFQDLDDSTETPDLTQAMLMQSKLLALSNAGMVALAPLQLLASLLGGSGGFTVGNALPSNPTAGQIVLFNANVLSGLPDIMDALTGDFVMYNGSAWVRVLRLSTLITSDSVSSDAFDPSAAAQDNPFRGVARAALAAGIIGYPSAWEHRVYMTGAMATYSGDTFRALRTVPASIGAPSENPTYWERQSPLRLKSPGFAGYTKTKAPVFNTPASGTSTTKMLVLQQNLFDNDVIFINDAGIGEVRRDCTLTVPSDNEGLGNFGMGAVMTIQNSVNQNAALRIYIRVQSAGAADYDTGTELIRDGAFTASNGNTPDLLTFTSTPPSIQLRVGDRFFFEARLTAEGNPSGAPPAVGAWTVAFNYTVQGVGPWLRIVVPSVAQDSYELELTDQGIPRVLRVADNTTQGVGIVPWEQRAWPQGQYVTYGGDIFRSKLPVAATVGVPYVNPTQWEQLLPTRLANAGVQAVDKTIQATFANLTATTAQTKELTLQSTGLDPSLATINGSGNLAVVRAFTLTTAGEYAVNFNYSAGGGSYDVYARRKAAGSATFDAGVKVLDGTVNDTGSGAGTLLVAGPNRGFANVPSIALQANDEIMFEMRRTATLNPNASWGVTFAPRAPWLRLVAPAIVADQYEFYVDNVGQEFIRKVSDGSLRMVGVSNQTFDPTVLNHPTTQGISIEALAREIVEYPRQWTQRVYRAGSEATHFGEVYRARRQVAATVGAPNLNATDWEHLLPTRIKSRSAEGSKNVKLVITDFAQASTAQTVNLRMEQTDIDPNVLKVNSRGEMVAQRNLVITTVPNGANDSYPFQHTFSQQPAQTIYLRIYGRVKSSGSSNFETSRTLLMESGFTASQTAVQEFDPIGATPNRITLNDGDTIRLEVSREGSTVGSASPNIGNWSLDFRYNVDGSNEGPWFRIEAAAQPDDAFELFVNADGGVDIEKISDGTIRAVGGGLLHVINNFLVPASGSASPTLTFGTNDLVYFGLASTGTLIYRFGDVNSNPGVQPTAITRVTVNRSGNRLNFVNANTSPHLINVWRLG